MRHSQFTSWGKGKNFADFFFETCITCMIVNMFRRSWSCGWVAAVARHVAVHVGQVACAQVNLAVAVAIVVAVAAIAVAVVAVVVVDVATRLLGQWQV